MGHAHFGKTRGRRDSTSVRRRSAEQLRWSKRSGHVLGVSVRLYVRLFELATLEALICANCQTINRSSRAICLHRGLDEATTHAQNTTTSDLRHASGFIGRLLQTGVGVDSEFVFDALEHFLVVVKLLPLFVYPSWIGHYA